MVVNPLTIHPDATLADALTLMKENGISGIPVVEGGSARNPGKLVGILTNRDVRFATDPRQKVHELMTKEKLVTVREGVSSGRGEAALAPASHREAAGGRWRVPLRRLGHGEGHRKGGWRTRTPARTIRGRLRVGAATTVGEAGFGRTERLIEAGVDLVVR